MEPQQIVSVVLLFFVYAVSATGWIHRAATALVGAIAVAALWGLPALARFVVPEVLLVTAGLMILAGFVRRSGIASWLALVAAKLGRGRPSRLLVLTGLLSWALGALLGPVAAVVLLVPVALLLAVELDVPALPFVVVLTWTALLGAATTLTALPGNLWLGAALGIDAAHWLLTLLPYTLSALVVTLVTATLVFGKRLRVTNERRARVLEYDERQSLSDRPLALKTLVVLGLVVCGLAAGPWLGLSPSVVTLGGAVLLWLWDSPRSTERFLSDLEGGSLLFLGGLMAVVGALVASGLVAGWHLPEPHPFVTLVVSALASTVLDHNAVVGLALPFLAGWQGSTWVFVALGTAIGAGTTILGSLAGTTALGLTGQGTRRVDWRQFSLYGALFASVNLATVAVLATLLG